MKKLVQISLVTVLVFALAFGLLLVAGGSVSAAGGQICPMVGWNTRSCSAYVALPTLGAQVAGLPPVKPNVGWNS